MYQQHLSRYATLINDDDDVVGQTVDGFLYYLASPKMRKIISGSYHSHLALAHQRMAATFACVRVCALGGERGQIDTTSDGGFIS